ncbi:N,N-dimethylformamidase beta subunit family domain-containing protein [Pseudonocardia sp. NPDC049154]|uniref:N,N-dimethylformamidase beta subunit family domain-containing protein n=1 Tax=Pseudonocardia sp. NPDC049154 TaxID=3155501 RepID=UPI0033FF0BD8
MRAGWLGQSSSAPVVVGLVAVLALVGACTVNGSGPVPPPSVPPSVSATTVFALPPGSVPGADWRITHPGPEHAVEGFVDRTSVHPGEPVHLFVSTTAAHYTITAFRMGDYPPTGAARVWVSPPEPGRRQADPVVQAPRNTVVAPWSPSLTVDTAGWPPGDYLLRLDADNGAQQFVPLTLATSDNTGRLVVVNAVTTWQGYNRWGGYSLYAARSGRFADRSRAVSFDRPYQAKDMQGAGDFLIFELPFVEFAERSGLPIGYATDVDLHADPHLLDGARAMITLGHDEYWSTAMRASATAARDRGVNLAFLGGNEIYRHIRFEDSALGPDRVEVDYKSFQEDPASGSDPLEATPQWRDPPHARPESVLLGNFYQCNPAQADLVVADAGSWLLSGLVRDGQRLPGLVGNEYERVDLRVPTPRPIEVLFHSPVTCRGRADFADATWYSVPSGAGVFSAGTQYWICGLDPGCRGGQSAAVVGAITARLLTAFAAGPAGAAHPAQDNLGALGIEHS